MNIFKRLKLWIIDEILEIKSSMYYIEQPKCIQHKNGICYLAFLKKYKTQINLFKNIDKNFIDKQRSCKLIEYSFKEKVDKIL